jgi:hypothetical protein
MHLYYGDTPIHIDNAALVMCDVESHLRSSSMDHGDLTPEILWIWCMGP